MRDLTAARAKALASREAATALRSSQRITLPDGSLIYPDSPPGIGWVLERPRMAKRYFATKAQAVADHKDAIV